MRESTNDEALAPIMLVWYSKVLLWQLIKLGPVFGSCYHLQLVEI